MSGGRTREAKQALPNHLPSSLLVFFVSLVPVLYFQNGFGSVSCFELLLTNSSFGVFQLEFYIYMAVNVLSGFSLGTRLA